MNRKILVIAGILAIVLVSGCVNQAIENGEPFTGNVVKKGAQSTVKIPTVGEMSVRGDLGIKLLDIEAVKLYPPTYLKTGYIMEVRVTNFGSESVEFPYEAMLVDQGGNKYMEAAYNKAISGKISPDGASEYGEIRIWDVPADAKELTLKINSGKLSWEFEVL